MNDEQRGISKEENVGYFKEIFRHPPAVGVNRLRSVKDFVWSAAILIISQQACKTRYPRTASRQTPFSGTMRPLKTPL